MEIMSFRFSIHQVDWFFILSMSLLSLAFLFIMVSLAIRASKRKIVTGQEGLINQIGVVTRINKNNTYTVRVAGELWQAESSSTLSINQKIIIMQIKGLILIVEPINFTGEK